MTWAVTFNIFGTKRKLIRSLPQLGLTLRVVDEAMRLYVGLGDMGNIQVFDIIRGTRLRTYDVGGSAESLSYSAGTLYVSGRDGIRSLRLR